MLKKFKINLKYAAPLIIANGVQLCVFYPREEIGSYHHFRSLPKNQNQNQNFVLPQFSNLWVVSL